MFRNFRTNLANLLSGPKNQRKGRNKSSSRSLAGCESLEDRKLMAHLAVLDFDGANVTAAQMTQGHWVNKGPINASGFNSLFTSANPMLDVNADGQVNGTDAQLAINRIVAKVQQDYSPYDLTIVTGNLGDHPNMLTDSQVGDVMLVVSGGTNNVDTQSANGLSPWTDLGNENDEIGFVFGQACMTTMTSADMVINSVARSISHEMGHCFGLGHITATPTGMAEAQSHHIMGVEVNQSNPAHRDYTHDFTFEDISYQTDAITGHHSTNHPEFNTANQNSYQYLSNSAVLGPSSNAWIAMLKPGELTINGDVTSNTINVAQSFTNIPILNIHIEHWAVTASSLHYVRIGTTVASYTTTVSTNLEPTTPGINSLNPYSTAVGKITVNAQGGDDTITVGSGITAALYAYGGSGRDTITGGAGNDHLFGDAENDKLYGGNGNDFLYGGLGSDELHGQGGNDSLYGDSANSDDGVVDYLYGELGNDTFYQKRSLFYAPVVQDSYVDYTAGVDSIVRFDVVYNMSPN